MLHAVTVDSSNEQSVSHGRKFFYILLVGALMVLATNFMRFLTGDLAQFQITMEGLNKAIMLFALGAAVIGVFSSNPDRSIFGRYVFWVGAVCTFIVFMAYQQNWIVLGGFVVQVLISSLMIARIRVPYP